MEDRRARPEFLVGAAIAVAGIIAVCLRWTGLDAQSMWGDEGYTVWLSRLPPGTIWHDLLWDTGPPLYYVLQHYWMQHFGSGAVAVRALSTIFVTLSLPLEYLLIRKILSQWAARVVAAGFTAFSFLQIWYGQEARFYGLLLFFLLGGVYSLLSYLEKRTLVALAGVVVCTTGSLYTHNMALFYMPGFALIWWFYPSDLSLKTRVKDAAVTAAIVLLAYVPWLPSLRTQIHTVHRVFWYPMPRAVDLLDTFSALCGLDLQTFQIVFRDKLRLHTHTLFGAWTWGPILVAVFLVFLVRARKNPVEFRKILSLVAYAVLPVLLVFLQSRFSTPIFQPRYLLASSFFLPLVFCLPFTEPRGPRTWAYRTVALLVLVGCVASCFEFPRRYHKDDWRGVTAYVLQEREIPRLVVVAPDFLQYMVQYYAPNPPPGMEISGLFSHYDPPDPDLQRRILELEPSAKILVPESWKKWDKYKEIDVILAAQSFRTVEPTLAYLKGRCVSMQEVDFAHLELERCLMEASAGGRQGVR